MRALRRRYGRADGSDIGVGDRVIWAQRIRQITGKGYREWAILPTPAIVIAISAKRVRITETDQKHPRTVSVSSKSLTKQP